jgi:hypothetical protein
MPSFKLQQQLVSKRDKPYAGETPSESYGDEARSHGSTRRAAPEGDEPILGWHQVARPNGGWRSMRRTMHVDVSPQAQKGRDLLKFGHNNSSYRGNKASPGAHRSLNSGVNVHTWLKKSVVEQRVVPRASGATLTAGTCSKACGHWQHVHAHNPPHMYTSPHTSGESAHTVSPLRGNSRGNSRVEIAAGSHERIIDNKIYRSGAHVDLIVMSTKQEVSMGDECGHRYASGCKAAMRPLEGGSMYGKMYLSSNHYKKARVYKGYLLGCTKRNRPLCVRLTVSLARCAVRWRESREMSRPCNDNKPDEDINAHFPHGPTVGSSLSPALLCAAKSTPNITEHVHYGHADSTLSPAFYYNTARTGAIQVRRMCMSQAARVLSLDFCGRFGRENGSRGQLDCLLQSRATCASFMSPDKNMAYAESYMWCKGIHRASISEHASKQSSTGGQGFHSAFSTWRRKLCMPRNQRPVRTGGGLREGAHSLVGTRVFALSCILVTGGRRIQKPSRLF